RDRQVLRRHRCDAPIKIRMPALDGVARGVGVQHVPHTQRSSARRSRITRGSLPGRSSRKSGGTSAASRTSKNCFQLLQFGSPDRITSPVTASRRMNTSSPSKRNSAGSRTAWLPPLVKSLATFGFTVALQKSIRGSIYEGQDRRG